MTSIGKIIKDAILARLTEKCQTEIDPEDLTYVSVIKVGALHDDPRDPKTVLMLRPATDGKQDETNAVAGERASYSPNALIGGGSFYRKRWQIEFSIFIEVEDFETALDIANTIVSRVKHALITMPVPPQVDDFGEACTAQPIVTSYAIDEGGGRGKYNWRGEMWIEFLTLQRPI